MDKKSKCEKCGVYVNSPYLNKHQLTQKCNKILESIKYEKERQTNNLLNDINNQTKVKLSKSNLIIVKFD